MKTGHLLVFMGLACGCQSASPPPATPAFVTPAPPVTPVAGSLKVPAELKDWSVRLTITHEAKGPSSGYFVEVRSDGSGETESWSSGSAVGVEARHKKDKLRVSAEDLVELKKTLLDPQLAREPVNESGTQELQVVLNGAATIFHFDGETPAALAPLEKILTKIAPPYRL